ncbi:MAG: Maf family protein [Pseudomonadota bacterium]
MTELVLASGSRYRAELLSRLGLEFEIAPPAVDETAGAGEDPEALVLRLAHSKAAAAAEARPDALVIGSDQVAVCDGEILGKPGTRERACRQLAALSGCEVLFHTGLCVLDTARGKARSAVVSTPVRFRALEPAEIEHYVDREQPLDCAGAFKSEGLGIALFESIGGEDPTALIGLPLIELCRMLRESGMKVL